MAKEDITLFPQSIFANCQKFCIGEVVGCPHCMIKELLTNQQTNSTFLFLRKLSIKKISHSIHCLFMEEVKSSTYLTVLQYTNKVYKKSPTPIWNVEQMIPCFPSFSV